MLNMMNVTRAIDVRGIDILILPEWCVQTI